MIEKSYKKYNVKTLCSVNFFFLFSYLQTIMEFRNHTQNEAEPKSQMSRT